MCTTTLKSVTLTEGDPHAQPTRAETRQSLRNWGKSIQTLVCITIKPHFQVRKSYPTNSQHKKEKMIRPWVKVSLCQYMELKRLGEEKGKPLSQIIREAVGEFMKKKDFPVDPAVSSLSRGSDGGDAPIRFTIFTFGNRQVRETSQILNANEQKCLPPELGGCRVKDRIHPVRPS